MRSDQLPCVVRAVVLLAVVLLVVSAESAARHRLAALQVEPVHSAALAGDTSQSPSSHRRASLLVQDAPSQRRWRAHIRTLRRIHYLASRRRSQQYAIRRTIATRPRSQQSILPQTAATHRRSQQITAHRTVETQSKPMLSTQSRSHQSTIQHIARQQRSQQSIMHRPSSTQQLTKRPKTTRIWKRQHQRNKQLLGRRNLPSPKDLNHEVREPYHSKRFAYSRNTGRRRPFSPGPHLQYHHSGQRQVSIRSSLATTVNSSRHQLKLKKGYHDTIKSSNVKSESEYKEAVKSNQMKTRSRGFFKSVQVKTDDSSQDNIKVKPKDTLKQLKLDSFQSDAPHEEMESTDFAKLHTKPKSTSDQLVKKSPQTSLHKGSENSSTTPVPLSTLKSSMFESKVKKNLRSHLQDPRMLAVIRRRGAAHHAGKKLPAHPPPTAQNDPPFLHSPPLTEFSSLRPTKVGPTNTTPVTEDIDASSISPSGGVKTSRGYSQNTLKPVDAKCPPGYRLLWRAGNILCEHIPIPVRRQQAEPEPVQSKHETEDEFLENYHQDKDMKPQPVQGHHQVADINRKPVHRNHKAKDIKPKPGQNHHKAEDIKSKSLQNHRKEEDAQSRMTNSNADIMNDDSERSIAGIAVEDINMPKNDDVDFRISRSNTPDTERSDHTAASERSDENHESDATEHAPIKHKDKARKMFPQHNIIDLDIRYNKKRPRTPPPPPPDHFSSRPDEDSNSRRSESSETGATKGLHSTPRPEVPNERDLKPNSPRNLNVNVDLERRPGPVETVPHAANLPRKALPRVGLGYEASDYVPRFGALSTIPKNSLRQPFSPSRVPGKTIESWESFRSSEFPTVSEADRSQFPTLSEADGSRFPTVSKADRFQIPTVSKADRSQVPTVSEADRSQFPIVSEADRSQFPTVSEADRSQFPIVSKADRSQFPTVSEAGRSQFPIVSEADRSQFPIVSEADRSQFPTVSKADRSQFPTVSEAGRSQFPIVSEADRSQFPIMSEADRSQFPTVSEADSPCRDDLCRNHSSQGRAVRVAEAEMWDGKTLHPIDIQCPPGHRRALRNKYIVCESLRASFVGTTEDQLCAPGQKLIPLPGGKADCVDDVADPMTCQKGYVMVTSADGTKHCQRSTVAACPKGQVPVITDTGYHCQYPTKPQQPPPATATTTPTSFSCPQGQQLLHAENGPVCLPEFFAAALKPSPSSSLSSQSDELCPSGMTAVETSVGLYCFYPGLTTVSPTTTTPAGSECPQNLTVVMTSTGAVCGFQAAQAMTGICPEQQVPVWRGGQYECSPKHSLTDADTLCPAGQQLVRTKSGSTICQYRDPGVSVDVLGYYGCADGQILTQLSAGFFCQDAGPQSDDRDSTLLQKCPGDSQAVRLRSGQLRCLPKNQATLKCSEGMELRQTGRGYFCQRKGADTTKKACRGGEVLLVMEGRSLCMRLEENGHLCADGYKPGVTKEGGFVCKQERVPLSCPIGFHLSSNERGNVSCVHSDPSVNICKDTAFIDLFGERVICKEGDISGLFVPCVDGYHVTPSNAKGGGTGRPICELADYVTVVCRDDGNGTIPSCIVRSKSSCKSCGTGRKKSCVEIKQDAMRGCRPRCANGGKCLDGRCQCPAGVTGIACQEDINECKKLPAHFCQHGCLNLFGSFRCMCPQHATLNADGRTCHYTHCLPHCMNGGRCVRGLCHCPPGYSGISCEQDVDECEAASHSCQHKCVNSMGSYACVCSSGFALASDRRTCTSITCNPKCRNGGRCEDQVCVCPRGFTGFICQLDINECRGRHGCSHYCINSYGSYRCACPRGFTLMNNGKTCTNP